MTDDPMKLAERLAQIDPTKPWYSIEAAASTGETKRAKVLIYGAIGGWIGVNAAAFAREVAALDVDEIELHVNSPGGAAWDGIAIMNTLRQHKAHVVGHVDGMAASAASAIAMGCDELVMARGSQLMIHEASGGAWGPAAYMRKTADILDKLSNNYAGIYAARAGGAKDEWRARMLDETWYDADEAVAAGLADRTDDDTEADVDAMAAFDLTMFVYAGREVAPPPAGVARVTAGIAAPLSTTSVTRPSAVAVTKSPVSSEPGYHNREEGPVDHAEFLNGLRSRLGVSNAEADEAMILAALDEALTERASDASADLADGVVAVDKALLEQLQADAAAGRQALANQDAARRDGIVTDALQGGKISPAVREKWRAALDRDEAGTVELLSGMPAIVPVGAKAVAGSLEDASSEDALYRQAFGATTKEA